MSEPSGAQQAISVRCAGSTIALRMLPMEAVTNTGSAESGFWKSIQGNLILLTRTGTAYVFDFSGIVPPSGVFSGLV
jgi:hypothetical protein